ncbi:minor tail protein [Microbacterium phage Morrigan]|nr:minor tail protein [Microbacterium phage Morrigan]
MATPIIPIKSLTTQEVLYGDRTTRYRWEVLEHRVLRNYLGDPRVSEAGNVGWVGFANTTRSAGLPTPPGTNSVKATVSANGGGIAWNVNGTPRGPWVSPAGPTRMGAWVKAASGTVLKISAAEYEVGPVLGGFQSYSDVITTGAWQWIGINYVKKTNSSLVRLNVQLDAAGSFEIGAGLLTPGEGIPVSSDYFDGSAAYATSYWEGVANQSISYQVPVADSLLGTLDGVSDGSLSFTQNAAIKGRGKIEVIDLDSAAEGMLRIGDLKLESIRLRPVCAVEGLPENPLGIFLVSSAGEGWQSTGREWELSLLDRATVPSQDSFDQSYSVPAGALVLQTVRTILATCGEYIAINDSSTLATSSGMVWEAGTSKLTIINDLLDVAGYNSLWVDGMGDFQATPRVLPANRSVVYEALGGIPRELRDGERSIYSPEWSRDRDNFDVPNKVIAVQAAGGTDSPALTGVWTNEDPNSPYSFPSRGRWIPKTVEVDVPAGTSAEIIAFLQSRARATLVQMSAVQAEVKVEHLPIPARVGDAIRFAHSKAGVDARHIITKIDLETSSTGLMKSTLQEVISL